MKVILDVEGNGFNPTKLWVVVCKDIDSGRLEVFRRPTDEPAEADRLREYLHRCSQVIGHNALGYDCPVLCRLLSIPEQELLPKTLDTFVISKLVDYPREKHSVEHYGQEFGLEKGDFSDFSRYSPEMEAYCIRDVEITEKIYLRYKNYINKHSKPVETLHKFARICHDIEKRGFMLDVKKVDKLLEKVGFELNALDTDIQETFVPRLKPIREVQLRATKYGTISLSSVPKVLRDSIDQLDVDAPFTLCHWVDFNPSSPKQIIEVLNEAGWSPTEKTKTHIETERTHSKLSRQRKRPPEFDLSLKELYDNLERLKITGWKVNENNLATLPPNAPQPARLLSKRILYEARRRTLTEWKELVRDDGRVHGKFLPLGAWTHRMAHQHPNMANIANEYDTNGKVKLLGKELRQCWIVPKHRLLVGVDAESIQLRIFAHYINDPEFTEALINGKKSDKSDPHSLNQRILGAPCKSRAAAKRWIFAFLLGAGQGKLREILDCNENSATEAYERLIGRYVGLAKLKSEVIPLDAKRGWFVGLDGRRVRIPGDTEGGRRHLAMSGYLQNGEAVVIETAVVNSYEKLLDIDSFFVNIVHDETQIETPNDFKIALKAAEIVDQEIRQAGVSLNLNCPLKGSYFNDDHNTYTIGRNWYTTH